MEDEGLHRVLVTIIGSEHSANNQKYRKGIDWNLDEGLEWRLTHVPAAVLGFDVAESQVPVAVAVVRQADSWIARDRLHVDGQYRLRVDAHPRHLIVPQGTQKKVNEYERNKQWVWSLRSRFLNI